MGRAAESGANAHQLKIELTESLLLRDVEDGIAKMRALREQAWASRWTTLVPATRR